MIGFFVFVVDGDYCFSIGCCYGSFDCFDDFWDWDFEFSVVEVCNSVGMMLWVDYVDVG